MLDQMGRTIDYLRISVTDRCNLRCSYCMPKQGIEPVPHDSILTFDEIYRIVRIMAALGITKVRFTGGEPLVRRNLVKLINDVSHIIGIEDIAMTSNGVLLAENLDALKAAGLKRVNISLDTCDRNNFIRITGTDAYEQVVEAIDYAVELGLKVKINCVACQEFNKNELEKIAAIARDKPIDVRFIELMPIGCGKAYHGILSDEILGRLEKEYGAYVPVDISSGNGPAQYYSFQGFVGKIGFISPMSHKFCGECSRVRLTSEGRLKLCLHYNTGVELKPLLRQGCSDDAMKMCILEAMKNKPKAHSFEKIGQEVHIEHKKMVEIGG